MRGDRIDGQAASAGPQQILVQEVSVEQNGPRGRCAQVHGGRPHHLQALQACRSLCRAAAGSLHKVRVIARPALQADVEVFERREGKLSVRGQVKSRQQVGGYLWPGSMAARGPLTGEVAAPGCACRARRRSGGGRMMFSPRG